MKREEFFNREWLSERTKQQSAHWRLKNEPELLKIDQNLRSWAIKIACFHEAHPEDEIVPKYQDEMLSSLARRRRLRTLFEARYGDAVSTEVIELGGRFVQLSPSKDKVDLLRAFSDFLRHECRDCEVSMASASEVMKEVWLFQGWSLELSWDVNKVQNLVQMFSGPEAGWAWKAR